MRDRESRERERQRENGSEWMIPIKRMVDVQ